MIEQYGGAPCEGPSEQYCNQDPCPVCPKYTHDLCNHLNVIDFALRWIADGRSGPIAVTAAASVSSLAEKS